MPRFYFHLINDIDVPDLEGVELPDIDAARAQAATQARGMIGEMTKTEGRIVLHHRIDIEDEDGTVLASVIFGDVITVED